MIKFLPAQVHITYIFAYKYTVYAVHTDTNICTGIHFCLVF